MEIEQKLNEKSIIPIICIGLFITLLIGIPIVQAYSSSNLWDEFLISIGIIPITKASHLDSNKNFISDIYDDVYQLDDIWSEEILEGDYVRVTFEIELDSSRDITVYPRIISGNPQIEVYEVDGTEIIAEFTTINSNEYNKIYLTNLNQTQDVFDLRIINGSLEFDHIIDPASEYDISFVLPTPDNGSSQSETNVEINVSITNASDLNQLIYNWNGTNYTIYNDSLILMYNFDNVPSLGENDTVVKDLSNLDNNGTINGATYSTKKIFDILYVDNFVKHPNNPLFNGTQTWEIGGIRDPSLMLNSTGYLIQEDGKYIMYYNGIDGGGAIQTGRATSPDGINWTKHSGPVFSEIYGGHNYTFVGSVIKKGAGDYIMYYSHYPTDGFNYATSNDGIIWTANSANDPIIDINNFSASSINIPYVTQIDGTWYMVFEGFYDTSSSWQIFMASSADGYTWAAENEGNPIYVGEAGWDNYATANPSLYKIESDKYVIFYNGEAEANAWDIGVLSSTNLTSGWTSWENNPILKRGVDTEWDDTRIEGARIYLDDLNSDTLRMWYFGLPTTNSFTGGAIGYATNNLTRINQYGNSIRCDGIDDYVDTGYDYSWTISQPFTMSLWFNKASEKEHVLLGKLTADYEYSLRITPTNQVSFAYFDTGGSSLISLWNAEVTANSDQWYYVTLTHNGTATTLYLDGVSRIVDSSSVGTLQNRALDTTICGGYYSSGSVHYFNGSIDEVRIHNYSLSSEEIYQLYVSNLNKYDTDKWTLYVNQSKNETSGLDLGSYTYQAFASDSSSNWNQTEERTVTITVEDNEYPQFSSYLDNNATLLGSGTAWFNSTITHTNGTVFLEIDGSNYSASNISDVFNTTVTTLTEGTYAYYWGAWGNGTSENYNTSGIRYYTMNSSGQCSPVLNEDWIISDTQTCDGVDVTTGTGNINIETGGELYLINYANITTAQLILNTLGDQLFINSGSRFIIM